MDYLMYINGEFVESKTKRTITSINPATSEKLAVFPRAGKDDVEYAVESGHLAFKRGKWADMSAQERGGYLLKIAQGIGEEAKELAELETKDNGKPLKETIFIDVNSAISCFEFYANNAQRLLEDGCINPADNVQTHLTREPVGVVAHIIPWNYPLLMASWKLAPSLVTGNSIILKPSCETSLTALELAKIIDKAGLPKGVVSIITGTGEEVGMELIRHTKVDMISFTGSTSVGKLIMKEASVNLKKLVLELGGKSANIIFGDADVDVALGGAMTSIFMNQGQMCTAGSRLLVQEDIYDRFVERLVEKTQKIRLGNGLDPDTDMGPLISSEQRQKVLSYIQIGKKEGACLLTGGKVPADEKLENGFFLEPTIFETKDAMSTIAQEEIFGPVLTIMKFKTEGEAIDIANNTRYGLASMIWTKDLNKAHKVSRQLKAGSVWINTYGAFYNEVPFGGVKESGLGRELGREGLLEYANLKSTTADTSGRPLVSMWFSR